MLVLRRKAGEAIVLNGVITIYVLAVEGERVKLGIAAPPEVVIVRSELLDTPGGAPGGPMGGMQGGAPGGATGGAPSGMPGGMAAPSAGPSPEYARPQRGPERPYREPEPLPRPQSAGNEPSGMGGMGGMGEMGGAYSTPARYTPRRRFDNYGEESGGSLSDGHDPQRYR